MYVLSSDLSIRIHISMHYSIQPLYVYISFLVSWSARVVATQQTSKGEGYLRSGKEKSTIFWVPNFVPQQNPSPHQPPISAEDIPFCLKTQEIPQGLDPVFFFELPGVLLVMFDVAKVAVVAFLTTLRDKVNTSFHRCSESIVPPKLRKICPNPLETS